MRDAFLHVCNRSQRLVAGGGDPTRRTRPSLRPEMPPAPWVQ